jgi:hypothetical protein
MALPNFLRPNYFVGKLLGVDDFRREQEYHREKNRLRNRLVVGTGVLAGLRVAVDGQELVVSPGVAIDCQGNELVLEAEYRQPLPDKSGRHFVTVRYAEVQGPSIPIPSDSFEDSSAPDYTEETVTIEVQQSLPAFPSHTIDANLQGCAEPHAICLATITCKASRWRVVSSRSRHRHK